MDPAKPPSTIVAITGGTGSGKSSLADGIQRAGGGCVSVLREDWYYLDLKHLPLDERDARNFDHPDSYDRTRLFADLESLKRNQPATVPNYDFRTHTRNGDQPFEGAPFILVEGIMILADERTAEFADLSVYVETPEDIRLLRRIERDMRERARTFASIRDQYLATVRPMHERYVAPSQDRADLTVRGDADIDEAISTVWTRMQRIRAATS